MTAHARHAQAGLSLIELQVALVIGLLALAAAVQSFGQQGSELRHLGREIGLMQELRPAMELISAQLRRCTHASLESGPGMDGSTLLAGSAAPDRLQAHEPAADHADGSAFRYRLRSGVLELQIGPSSWQALTDPGRITVSDWRVEVPTLRPRPTPGCTPPCATTADGCEPALETAEVRMRVRAHSPLDPDTARELQSTVRLRNAAPAAHCTP